MENQFVEYKQSWRDEFMKELCAFANAQGGSLYIGVADNGHVCGLNNAKELMENLPNILFVGFCLRRFAKARIFKFLEWFVGTN